MEFKNCIEFRTIGQGHVVENLSILCLLDVYILLKQKK